MCLGVLGGALLALGQVWPPLRRAQQLLIALIQDMAQQSTAGRKVRWETRQTGSRTQGRATAGPASLSWPSSSWLTSSGGWGEVPAWWVLALSMVSWKRGK